MNRRTQRAPKYTINHYENPISAEPVRDLRKALFIQVNVRNGKIHGLYDPENLYQWFDVHEKTVSPLTKRQVTLPFLHLPEYLQRGTQNASSQTNERYGNKRSRSSVFDWLPF
jgi:hypothetical protein